MSRNTIGDSQDVENVETEGCALGVRKDLHGEVAGQENAGGMDNANTAVASGQDILRSDGVYRAHVPNLAPLPSGVPILVHDLP